MSIETGDGWKTGHLDDLGDGPGFRKVRRELDVKEFGVNAIVLPAGVETGTHWHERQEELYFVHRGTIEIQFGDGTRQTLGEGSFARVDAPTPRRIRTLGGDDAVYVIVGAQGGYVGRDGMAPPEDARVKQSSSS